MPTSTTKESLEPGKTIEFKFPNLPETLLTKAEGQAVVPTMTVRLPDTFDPSQPQPLFVFIRGANGGDGTHLDRALNITGGRDYIAVNLPLFKQNFDPNQKMALLLGAEDAPLASSAYATMLTKLYETVPKIDFKRSVFGGFSNGAHITSFMLNIRAACLYNRFRNFLLLEGGLHLSGLQYAWLKDVKILLLVGSGSEKSEPWRGAMLKLSEALVDLAAYYEVDLKRILMEDTGHAFPDRYIPAVRDWMKGL